MSDEAALAVAGSVAVIYSLIVLAIAVFVLIGEVKVFMKAGKPGWAVIVPFYNMYCLCDIAFGNGWLFLLYFVPCANVVLAVILQFKLAAAFGRDIGFGFGLLFLTPIFMMILGFGSAEYIGPQKKEQ